MTDQKLQKVAEELRGVLWKGTHTFNAMNDEILKSLTQVRDAQEEKLRIAREALELIVSRRACTIAKEALERMGVE